MKTARIILSIVFIALLITMVVLALSLLFPSDAAGADLPYAEYQVNCKTVCYDFGEWGYCEEFPTCEKTVHCSTNEPSETPTVTPIPTEAPETPTPDPTATPVPTATPGPDPKCNRGIGNGSEDCDPGNSSGQGGGGGRRAGEDRDEGNIP